MNNSVSQTNSIPASLTDFRTESAARFAELETKVRESERLICPDSHPRALASLNIARRQTKQLAEWLKQFENVPSEAYAYADIAFLASRMNYKVLCVESHLAGVNHKASDDKWLSYGFLFIILAFAAYAAFKLATG